MKSRQAIVKNLESRPDRSRLAIDYINAYIHRSDAKNKVGSPPYTAFGMLGHDGLFKSIAAALSNEAWTEPLSGAVKYKMMSHKLSYFWHHNFRNLFPESVQPLRVISWEDISETMAFCFLLGWHNEAIYEGNLAVSALKNGYHLELSYGKRHRQAQAFMIQLLASWQGRTKHNQPPILDDESIYRAILEHWRDRNAETLTKLLLEACDRHVRESHYDTDETFFDFCDDSVMRTPLEILMVFRLRERSGLDIPVLEHPLMERPFDGLVPPRPLLDDDPMMQAVLARLRSDWSDFDKVMSFHALRGLAEA